MKSAIQPDHVVWKANNLLLVVDQISMRDYERVDLVTYFLYHRFWAIETATPLRCASQNVYIYSNGALADNSLNEQANYKPDLVEDKVRVKDVADDVGRVSYDQARNPFSGPEYSNGF